MYMDYEAGIIFNDNLCNVMCSGYLAGYQSRFFAPIILLYSFFDANQQKNSMDAEAFYKKWRIIISGVMTGWRWSEGLKDSISRRVDKKAMGRRFCISWQASK